MARRPSPCVFCGLTNDGTTGRCAGCGGPLQAPVGADPGKEPPPVPRPIARAWVWREVFQFPVVWGTLFGGIGGGVGCITSVIGLVTLLLPLAIIGPFFVLIFGGIGGAAFFLGVQSGWRKLGLLRTGRPVVARVAAVTLDAGRGGEGPSPWRVQYLFDVDGKPVTGAADWWDAAASQFAEGDRLHVVYDPRDPTHNVPWPPPS